MTEQQGFLSKKLSLVWVIVIVVVIGAAAAVVAAILSHKETVLENHTVSIEDQRTLLEKADAFITDYYDAYIKDVIDNQEYTEIAIAKFSFDELDKKRDEMSLVYAENSPEFIKFIQDYDRLQHQYFLEFKDIIKEHCKSYEEEYRLGNITKKEFDRLNRLKDKYLK